MDSTTTEREDNLKTFMLWQTKNQLKSGIHLILILFLSLALASSFSSCKSNKSKASKPEKLSRKKKKKLNKAVILTSKKFIGTPYKWGGTTRAGMDCSGLLYTTYKLNNVNIPRSSAEQSKYGKKVGVNNVRQGDWLFFATGKKRKKITHVGMVTTVGGKENVKFIHASTSLGVTESQLYSKYWRKKFVRAIRPFH